jgi:hypothetical protein
LKVIKLFLEKTLLKDKKAWNYKDFQCLCVFITIIAFSILILILFFDQEGIEFDKFKNNFMGLIYKGRYKEAYQFVDSSRITMEELKEVSELSSHYSLGTIYSGKGKPLCNFGFKPNSLDKDKSNDKVLEFWIVKDNGEWKVINIYSKYKSWEPLYK